MPEKLFTYEVESLYQGKRIDAVVAAESEDLTRSKVQKLLADGNVTVNGEPVLKSYKVKTGDMIQVTVPAPQKLVAKAQDLPLSVVYEDDWLLIVNKPKGMVVHPAHGNETGTLANALQFHYPGNLSTIGGEFRPGIVHRIDRDTSGLLLVAKNDMVHKNLAAQIAAHTVKREYQAVVHGTMEPEKGRIDAPIGRNPKNRLTWTVIDKGSKPAVTNYKVLQYFEKYTFLSLRLETGRTHQIRVHMQYKGHPVAGDQVYGPSDTPSWLNGQCLHAKTIGFKHPITGEYMEFTSELPEYFRKFLSDID